MKTPTIKLSRIGKDKDTTRNTAKHKAVYSDDQPVIKKDETKDNSANRELEPVFVFEEYQNMRTLRKIPIDNIWIDALAKELTKWVDDNDDVIRLSQFLRKKAMLQVEFDRLAAKSPVLKRAYDYAMEKIAENREVGGKSFKMNWNVLSSTQSHYCKIAKGEAQFRAKLKEEQQQDNRPKFIVMESIEELAKQIEKKDEE